MKKSKVRKRDAIDLAMEVTKYRPDIPTWLLLVMPLRAMRQLTRLHRLESKTPKEGK